MLLTEILLKESKKPGTYVAVKFSDKTNNLLRQYAIDNKIPNRTRTDKLHTTVIYSCKHLEGFKHESVTFDPPLIGTVGKFEVWPTSPKPGTEPSNCLVLLYDCPELIKRHNQIMNDYDATYDFDEFKVHTTLSYDIGDLDWKSLPPISDVLSEIEIITDYSEPLNLDWADSSADITEKRKTDR